MKALSNSRTGDSAPAEPRPSATLAVAAFGVLLTLVAFTVPLATVAGTAAELRAGPGAQAWILSGMSVGAAAGLLSCGALGDDYGRRRTFVAGAAILTMGSVLAAAAPHSMLLVVARIVQGLGARR